MRRMLLALQFLTILPIQIRGSVTDDDLARSAAMFPLAGAIQGILTAAATFVFLSLFSPALAAGLSVLVLTAIAGGFHLDGLADTCDALAVKSCGDGQADRNRRLEVMKDSTTGAGGVTAIVLVVLIKYLLLAELFARAPVIASCVVMALVPAFSKWAINIVMFRGQPARPDGLGRLFFAGPRQANFLIATALIFSLSVLAVILLRQTGQNSPGLGFFLAAAGILSGFTLGAVRFFTDKFGGLTGDNFGATNEISELLFLMAATLWLRPST